MEKREKLAHLWDRDPNDWYVEPPECSRALFQEEAFMGTVWDPACGIGRIVDQAMACGLSAFGSDLMHRPKVHKIRMDFLAENPPQQFASSSAGLY